MPGGVVTPGVLLEPGEIHVWSARDQRIDDRALLALYHTWLCAEEVERMGRFVFERHRHQYLVTRALLRSTLSHYVPGVTPGQWRFTTNAWGKPCVVGPQVAPAFNLSHTEGRVVLALTREDSVGVDVETRERSVDVDLADRFFSADEVRYLYSLPRAAQASVFLNFWTLKEAYIKARGQGLSIALDSFSFDLSVPGQIGFASAALPVGAAQGWRFWQWEEGTFVFALGCCPSVSRPARMALRFYGTVPGLGYWPNIVQVERSTF
ncbi:4'-phosphopantetheinyl transferase family protein [Pseudomonas sp. SDO528_S397]